MTFKVGDRVQLKNSGYVGTVEKLKRDGLVMCVRFDDPKEHRRWNFESGWTNAEGKTFVRADDSSDYEFDV